MVRSEGCGTSSDNESQSVVRCVFCGKRLEADEMVRFLGAISCKECAEREGREHPQKRNSSWFRLAVPGAVMAAVINSIGLFLGTFIAGTPYAIYGAYVALFGISLATISPGFIGFYRNYDRPFGLLLALLCIINGVASVVFYSVSLSIDPLLSLEKIAELLTPSAQVVMASFMIMALFAGAYIPMTKDDHGWENLVLVVAVFLILAVTIGAWVGPILEYPLRVIAMTLLAIYFATARGYTMPSAKVL